MSVVKKPNLSITIPSTRDMEDASWHLYSVFPRVGETIPPHHSSKPTPVGRHHASNLDHFFQTHLLDHETREIESHKKKKVVEHN